MLLETVGAAAGTIPSVAAGAAANPTAAFVSVFPTWLADLTLLAITIGAIAANALNIYSGAISFTAIGIKLPLHIRRAIVALGFGTIGFFLAWSGLSNAGTKYNNFLLIIAYWIGPWLAVVFCDMFLRRRKSTEETERLLFDKKYANWAGPVAMAGRGGRLDLAVRQPDRVRRRDPEHWGNAGDLTFEVGSLLTAVIYLTWRLIADRSARAVGDRAGRACASGLAGIALPARARGRARGRRRRAKIAEQRFRQPSTMQRRGSTTVDAYLSERGKSRMALPAAGLYSRYRHLVPELLKFCVVGGLGAVIDLGGAAVLHGKFHVEALEAKAISTIIATVLTYLGSRFWTFKHRENQALGREVAIFVVLNVIGLAHRRGGDRHRDVRAGPAQPA